MKPPDPRYVEFGADPRASLPVDLDDLKIPPELAQRLAGMLMCATCRSLVPYESTLHLLPNILALCEHPTAGALVRAMVLKSEDMIAPRAVCVLLLEIARHVDDRHTRESFMYAVRVRWGTTFPLLFSGGEGAAAGATTGDAGGVTN